MKCAIEIPLGTIRCFLNTQCFNALFKASCYVAKGPLYQALGRNLSFWLTYEWQAGYHGSSLHPAARNLVLNGTALNSYIDLKSHTLWRYPCHPLIFHGLFFLFFKQTVHV